MMNHINRSDNPHTTLLFLVCLFTTNPYIYCNQQVAESRAPGASYKCEHGLATYEEVKKGLGETSGMDEGRTGRVDGYGELSEVITLESCFQYIQATPKLRGHAPHTVLRECVKSCHDGTLDYIGVKGTTCYCITAQERRSKLQWKTQVNRNDCNMECGSPLSPTCTYVRIYRIRNAIQVQGHGQCVYISKEDQHTIIYNSASCHSVTGITINGFICSDIQNCPQPFGGFPFACVNESPNDSWIQAYEMCSNASGSLISLVHKTTFYHYIYCCVKKYWVGGFRTLTPVSHPTNTCLAVTKVKTGYVLESDDCAPRLSPICLKAEREMNHAGVTDKDQKSRDYLPIAIGVTLAIVLLVALLICVFVICNKKRKKSSIAKTLLNHENDFTSGSIGNDNTENTREERHRNGDEPREAQGSQTQPTPVKPKRNTLRRQKQSVQSYENFQLVPKVDTDNHSTETSVAIAKEAISGDEYDTIDLTLPNKRRNDTSNDKVDMHMYSHTMPNHDNDYDTTTTLRLTTKPIQSTYYSVTTVKDSQINEQTNPAVGTGTRESIVNSKTDDATLLSTDQRLDTLKGISDTLIDTVAMEETAYVCIDDDQLTMDTVKVERNHDYVEVDFAEVDNEERIIGQSDDNEKLIEECKDVYSTVEKRYVNTNINGDKHLS